MPQFRFFLQPRSFEVLADRNLKLLFLLRVVRDLINTMAFFFLPIFLFVTAQDIYWLNDYGLSSLQKGFLVIAAYFLLERATVFCTAIPAGKYIKRFGFTHSLFISHLVRVFGFVALCYFQGNPLALLVAGFFEGVQSNLFWPSYFTLFSKHSDTKQMGKDLGIVQFFIQLLAVFTPAFGGYLALQFGFTSLFFMAIAVCLFASLIPLIMELETTTDSVSWREFKEWFTQPVFKRLAVSFIGRYIYDSVLFLWPLYIFLIVGSIEKVGFIYTFSLFIAMVIIFFLSGYINQTKTRKSFFLSGGSISLLWFVRIFIWNVWSIVLVDATEKMIATFYWLFYDMTTLRRSKGSQALSYFIYREVVISAAAFLLWICIALFFWFIGNWNIIFMVGGVGVLLSLLLTEHHHAKLR